MVRLIAITGGIGSGKSTFSKVLCSLGYVVVNADKCVEEVLTQPEIISSIKRLIGDSAYDASGKYSRECVRNIVFSDSTKRTALEAIVHPAVRGMLQSFAQHTQRLAPETWIFYEIPLLFEVGREKDFDVVILVTASDEERMRRCVLSRGLSEEQVRAVISSQMSEADKRLAADYVVENVGDLSDLEVHVRHAIDFLRTKFHLSKN